MNTQTFDLSSVVDPVVESIRIRLPELIAAEVRRQLAASLPRAPALTDAELRQRNALRAQAGLPLLPGVGAPKRSAVTTARGDVRERFDALRERKP